MVAGQGFEPRFYGPKPHVLPLDDPATMRTLYQIHQNIDRGKTNPLT